MSTKEIKVPRLPKGRGYRGPDFYGCFNTGTAPCIRRSRRTGKYIVGAESNTEMALNDARLLTNMRSWEIGGRTVYVYKTRAPAVRRFEAMCEERIRENEEMRKKHEEDLSAREGDTVAQMTAALRLGMNY